jgi:hypothetical protein
MNIRPLRMIFFNEIPAKIQGQTHTKSPTIFVLFLSKKDSFTHCVCIKASHKNSVVKSPMKIVGLVFAREGVFGFATDFG